jgi:hypothetical protein
MRQSYSSGGNRSAHRKYDRILSAERVAQLILQAGKPVPPSGFGCHPEIVARVDGLALPGSPAGAHAAARKLIAAT